jgi:hypothetical protein
MESASDGLGFFHVDGVAGSGSTAEVPAHLMNNPITRVTLANSTPTGIPTVTEAVTVAENPVTFASSVDYQFGWPVVSRMDSLPIDAMSETGSTQARIKRQHKVKLSLYRSRGGEVWNVDMTKRQAIPNTRPALVLRSQWEETIPDAGSVVDLQLRIFHDDPFPFCLRAAIVQWNLSEKV